MKPIQSNKVNNSKDPNIWAFLNDLELLDNENLAIVEQCRSLFFAVHPSIGERVMYGGIMFSLSEDISGIFAYKNHVSMEFSFGYSMDDPNNWLEGRGKLRRHIKLFNSEQIEQKQVEFFVRQLSVKTT